MAFSQFPFPLAQFPHSSLGGQWCLVFISPVIARSHLGCPGATATGAEQCSGRRVYLRVSNGATDPGEETLAWDPSSYSLSQLHDC